MAESEPNKDGPVSPEPEPSEPSEQSVSPSDASEQPDSAEPQPEESDGSAPADSTETSDLSDRSESSDRSDESDEPLDLSRSALVRPEEDTEAQQEEAKPTTDQPPEVTVPPAEQEPEETAPASDGPPAESAALHRTVEALLFAAEVPLTVREIARAAGSRSNVIRKVLINLKEALDTEERPWELLEVAGGWRFATRAEHFPAIQKLKVQRSQRRLTPAAMEVLALIAYSQEPIGRAEIEAVRGVDSGPVLRLLLERKLVRIAGRGEGLGQPLLYAVSQEFLEHFGLKSTKDLPQPGEFKG